jgi:rare lipoprotein A
VAILISKKIVIIAGLFLFLSCASSPRYIRKTEVIPHQKTEQAQTIEKPSVAVSEPLVNEISIDTVKLINVDTATNIESEILSTDTVCTFYQQGVATYYADKFQGRKTAFGEHYDRKQYTAAHRTLPHNSLVRVTALSNKKSVIVRINDRGPFTKNRVIDLSKAAAKEIDLLSRGIMKVTIEIIEVKR